MADLEVTATLKGEIADLLTKLKIAQEAIAQFRREAKTKSDFSIATDLEKELARVAQLGKSGIIKNAVKKLGTDADAEAKKQGENVASRFAQSFRDRLKKEKFTPPGWLPWVGAGMLAAPGAIQGALGVLGGFGAAAFGAAAGLGALGLAAAQALGPVRQAFTTIDKLNTTGNIKANATALQTWLKAAPTITRTAGIAGTGALTASQRQIIQARIAGNQARLAASLASPRGTASAQATYRAAIAFEQRQLAGGGGTAGTAGSTTSTRNALGPGLGFLTNPNANWYTLSKNQQRNLVVAAQSTTGMPTSEKAQISALMAERQAYLQLDAAQQKALFTYTKFDNALVAAQKQAQPAVLSVYDAGLKALTPLLKYLAPLANQASKALVPLINQIGKGFQSSGFKDFMNTLIKASGPAIKGFGQSIINVGIGIGHIFTAITKSGLSTMMVNDLVKMTNSFKNFTGSPAFTAFVNEMKKNAPTLVDILKQLFQILGKLILQMGGGLSSAALKFLDLLLKGLNKLAGIPGIGPFLYNMTAFVLLFSKFGTLKAVGAIFDMIYRGLGSILALKFGGVISGMLGLDTKGMGVAKMWKAIGKAVVIYAKDMVVSAASAIKTGAIWLAKTIWTAATMAAAWVASAAASVAAWVVANAAMIILSGGIVLAIGAIVIGIFELLKHWKTVWGFIKRIADDAYKFLKITFLEILLKAAEWAKGMVHLAADAFSWIPFLGPKLKSADKAIGGFITSTKAHLASLTNPTYPIKLGIDLPKGVSSHDITGIHGGLAAGTSGAIAGWHVVGEKGPELVNMRGGETVIPNHAIGGYASGTSGVVVHLSLPSIRALAGMLSNVVHSIVRSVHFSGRLKPSAMGTGPGALGGPTSASAAQAQAYARSRLGAFGWNSSQMLPLIALWNQESGWNRFAQNPTSGAYGIPQALPPGKMGAAANPPQSSAAAQINWGLGYISSTYGSPANAEGHELSHHWYGYGGTIPFGGHGIVGDRGIEAVSVGPHGATVTPLKGGKPPFLLQVITNEINPRYHAAQLGWELARRSS